jgi:hypothetical protein
MYLLRTASTSVDHASRKLLVDQALCSAIFCCSSYDSLPGHGALGGNAGKNPACGRPRGARMEGLLSCCARGGTGAPVARAHRCVAPSP